MQDRKTIEDARTRRPVLAVQSGLRAGYSCPEGWWKYREDKKKMCCHWVWRPGYGYEVECNT